GTEQNPPIWPHSVYVFDESMATEAIEKKIDDLTDILQTPAGHFSPKRVALLFKPGTYKVLNEKNVGYYVQVLGLGRSPDETKFTGELGVWCPAADPGEWSGAGSLDTFWRSGENFATGFIKNTMWAVSQAAPLRSVNVKKGLDLYQRYPSGEPGGAYYASGGFMANMNVAGPLSLGSQQQWCSRNCNLRQIESLGAWNPVFIGSGASFPTPQENKVPDALVVTNIVKTPRVAEKPYIIIDGDTYSLIVPKHRDVNSSGSQDYGLAPDEVDVRSFDHVYVARCVACTVAEHDTAGSINAKLALGRDVVLSPGNYHLEASIRVQKNDQVLLGIGLASLIAPLNGDPCIKVMPELTNVRVAGVMLQASRLPDSVKSCLFEWGDDGKEDLGVAELPGVMSDIFARVRPGNDLDLEVNVKTIMRIHSGNVIGDNLWLWRADHTEAKKGGNINVLILSIQVVKGECECETGLEVNGDNVIIYGLAVEHTTKDLVIWNGKNGKVFFYQSELPYDADETYADHVGYRVNKVATGHEAHGVGVYSFFRYRNIQ
ncbi:unnamed protein product, partial [Chrysoparadoxa australica]